MKDKRDKYTNDWVDDAEERRERETQEHARRQARKEKLNARTNSTAPCLRFAQIPVICRMLYELGSSDQSGQTTLVSLEVRLAPKRTCLDGAPWSRVALKLL